MARMRNSALCGLSLLVLLTMAAAPADARKNKRPATIKDLDGQTVEVRPGNVTTTASSSIS